MCFLNWERVVVVGVSDICNEVFNVLPEWAAASLVTTAVLLLCEKFLWRERERVRLEMDKYEALEAELRRLKMMVEDGVGANNPIRPGQAGWINTRRYIHEASSRSTSSPFTDRESSNYTEDDNDDGLRTESSWDNISEHSNIATTVSIASVGSSGTPGSTETTSIRGGETLPNARVRRSKGSPTKSDTASKGDTVSGSSGPTSSPSAATSQGRILPLSASPKSFTTKDFSDSDSTVRVAGSTPLTSPPSKKGGRLLSPDPWTTPRVSDRLSFRTDIRRDNSSPFSRGPTHTPCPSSPIKPGDLVLRRRPAGYIIHNTSDEDALYDGPFIVASVSRPPSSSTSTNLPITLQLPPTSTTPRIVSSNDLIPYHGELTKQSLEDAMTGMEGAGNVFIVKRVRAEKVDAGKRLARVSWLGFGSEDDTWEEVGNVPVEDLEEFRQRQKEWQKRRWA